MSLASNTETAVCSAWDNLHGFDDPDIFQVLEETGSKTFKREKFFVDEHNSSGSTKAIYDLACPKNVYRMF